ncbi:MAG: hypothetical protein R2939_14185 [Kofleriaceae bacterium]
MKHLLVSVVALAAAASLGAGCGGRQRTIAGTEIPDTEANRAVLETVDAYRRAVEARDAETLMLLASTDYWEDSGTPSASDDYGYDGLRQVLAGRFQQADDIRFALRTVSIRRQCPTKEFGPGCRAHVEVLIDASFSVTDARGQERRPDKRDQNELVLQWTGDKWTIVAGM